MAYSGNPLQLDLVLFKAQHSLINQSLHSKLGVTTTNGDGFGVGWYGPRTAEPPFRYRSIQPAWSDRNLREAARAIHSSLFVAHIRAATDTPTQETNCHPFRHGNWLFVHNGLIRGYPLLRRELMMQIDPHYFLSLEGSTDSEVMFLLALTFGLEKDPLPALARMAATVEAAGHRNGIEFPLNMTICVLDGERMIAVRYSSEQQSRSLFHNVDVRELKQLYPDNARIAEVGDDSYMLLSEPLSELPGVWKEVPESTAIVAHKGDITYSPFVPTSGL